MPIKQKPTYYKLNNKRYQKCGTRQRERLITNYCFTENAFDTYRFKDFVKLIIMEEILETLKK